MGLVHSLTQVSQEVSEGVRGDGLGRLDAATGLVDDSIDVPLEDLRDDGDFDRMVTITEKVARAAFRMGGAV